MKGKCPHCSAIFAYAADGRREFPCPRCQAVLRLPTTTAAKIPPPPPPVPPAISQNMAPKPIWNRFDVLVRDRNVWLSVAAGVLAVIAVGTWTASLFRSRPITISPQKVVDLPKPKDEKLPQVAAKVLSIDDARFVEERKPGKAPHDLEVERARMARLLDVAVVTAEDLVDEFGQNSLAAEEKYKGRIIEVHGTVASVSRNSEGLPMVAMRGGSRLVRVFVMEDAVSGVQSLSVGDDAIMVGELSGLTPQVIDLAGGMRLKQSVKDRRKDTND